MSSSITYRDLTQLNWHRTEQALNDRNNPLPPFSVHIPLHFPESDTFVYWDGALNASLLPVPVGLQSGTPACEAALDAMTNRLLSFAPGEMPFLPDFRFTRMERLDGELPVIRSEYFHCDLLYRFDVCVAPNRTLQLRGSVTNLRGVIVPIVDLRIKFSQVDVDYNDNTVVIVLNLGQRVVGIVVDGVSDVLSLTAEQIRPAPEFAVTLSTEYLTGLGALGDRMLILVNIEKLLNSEEMALLDSAASEVA